MSIEVAEVVDQKYQVSEYRSIKISSAGVSSVSSSSAVGPSGPAAELELEDGDDNPEMEVTSTSTH